MENHWLILVYGLTAGAAVGFLVLIVFCSPVFDTLPVIRQLTDIFADGKTKEQAQRKKCHVFVGQNCHTSDCMAWKWVNGSKISWRRLFWKRRGMCNKADIRSK
jgi:hypothetical protein